MLLTFPALLTFLKVTIYVFRITIVLVSWTSHPFLSSLGQDDSSVFCRWRFSANSKVCKARTNWKHLSNFTVCSSCISPLCHENNGHYFLSDIPEVLQKTTVEIYPDEDQSRRTHYTQKLQYGNDPVIDLKFSLGEHYYHENIHNKTTDTPTDVSKELLCGILISLRSM